MGHGAFEELEALGLFLNPTHSQKGANGWGAGLLRNSKLWLFLNPTNSQRARMDGAPGF